MSFVVKDHYFHKAKKEKFLARSVYKLEEIDSKFKILNKNMRILDLGYYPGSWTQYAASKVGSGGLVMGLDIQEINQKLSSLGNVILKCCDFTEVRGLDDLGISDQFDVVLSDMAPKTTGISMVDQAASLGLVESVFNFLPIILKQNGSLVVKVFEGPDSQDFLRKSKSLFKEFHYLRPKSTRKVSREFFVIGKGLKI